MKYDLKTFRPSHTRLLLAAALSSVRLTIVTGLISILPACGGMRNLERNQESTLATADSIARLEQVKIFKQDKSLETLTVKSDSLNSSYTIEIWPKGKFSYNAEQGFEGTADKILIVGTVKQGKQSLSTQSINEHTGKLGKTSMVIDKRTSVIKKNAALKKLVSWKTVLGYALIAFCLIASLLTFSLMRKHFAIG
jgi:hypothetical protein